jgi:hypothetical protein
MNLIADKIPLDVPPLPLVLGLEDPQLDVGIKVVRYDLCVCSSCSRHDRTGVLETYPA